MFFNLQKIGDQELSSAFEPDTNLPDSKVNFKLSLPYRRNDVNGQAACLTLQLILSHK